jgi:hypothetical protein
MLLLAVVQSMAGGRCKLHKHSAATAAPTLQELVRYLDLRASHYYPLLLLCECHCRLLVTANVQQQSA